MKESIFSVKNPFEGWEIELGKSILLLSRDKTKRICISPSDHAVVGGVKNEKGLFYEYKFTMEELETLNLFLSSIPGVTDTPSQSLLTPVSSDALKRKYKHSVVFAGDKNGEEWEIVSVHDSQMNTVVFFQGDLKSRIIEKKIIVDLKKGTVIATEYSYWEERMIPSALTVYQLKYILQLYEVYKKMEEKGEI